MKPIDLKLLQLVQVDFSKSFEQIGEEVGLSASSCLRRLRSLTDRGIIKCRRAVLDDAKAGVEVCAFYLALLKDDTSYLHLDLREAVTRNDFVQSCHIVSGEFDVVMTAKFPTIREYQDFTFNFIEIMKPAQIQRYSSYISVRCIHERNILPIIMREVPDG